MAVDEPLHAYFRLCDAYRTTPHSAVVLSLKYTGVTYLAPDKGFGPCDLIPLCEVLRTNTTFTSLDFRRCKIGSHGCYALRDLLAHNRTIKQLSLPYSDVGEHGAQALAEGLMQNRTLEKLHLTGNRVGKHGSSALAAVLQHTSSLRFVDLSCNNIGSEGVKILAGALNDRFKHRAAAKAAARRAGVFTGDGAIKVKDIELLLDGNLVREEITSSILHGTGLVLSGCGAYPLLVAARESQDPTHFWGIIVYLCALLAMYASSTLGHTFFMFRRTSLVFKMIDHSAIYLLIAGTYTPFMLVNLKNKFSGRLLLGSIWALALFGVFFSTFLAKKYRQWRMHLACLIGWCAVVSYRSVVQCIHPNGLLLLALGGIVYSVGGYLYIRKGDEPFSHTAYMCALLGTALHYFAIYFYVQPSACTDTTDILPDWMSAWF